MVRAVLLCYDRFCKEHGYKQKGLWWMKVQNTLSKMISTAGQKAAYDHVCKKLLSHKMILAWLMKSCLPEYRDCTVHEIADKYIESEPQISKTVVHQNEKAGTVPLIKGSNTEDTSIREGTITFDIRFHASALMGDESCQLLINVEAQNDFYPGYPIVKRNLYYCSRMISAQYGTEFTHSHYEKLKKVYSIFICMKSPRYRKNTINCYSIHEKNMIGSVHEKKRHYDLMTAVLICLGDEQEEAETGILKLLEVLLSSNRTAEEKIQILQEEFQIEMTETLENEVNDMCNLSKGIEERGIQKGLEKGLETGRQQGLQKGRQESLQNLMKNMKLSTDQAMDILGIPEKERTGLRIAIKK